MKYQLIDKPAFLVTGKPLLTSQVENAAAGTITAFWTRCNQDGTSDELNRLMKPVQLGDALLGVCHDMQSDGSFEYLVGAEVPAPPGEGDLKTIVIPASRWLILESVGPMPHAIQEVWRQAFEEVLPACGCHYAGTAELEVYYDGNPQAADYRCEVWIPVR